MMNKLVTVLGVVCLLLAISQAQTDYAAVLQVNYGQVEVLRANTVAWIGLPVGAQTPFGVGDAVRTNTFGRAHLSLLNSAEVLVLPLSTFTLVQFSADEYGKGQVALSVEGRAIVHMTQADAFSQFQVRAPQLKLVAPAELFAVQSDESATTVVVARGTATITNSQEAPSSAVQLGNNVGIRANPSLSRPIRLTAPVTFAQLDGVLDGCIGVINAQRQANLNVRDGPTLNYDVVGTLSNGDVVQLLGVSPNKERYRVVYKAGFGWILALEVRTNCTDLPVFPYSTRERLFGILFPSEAELALLVPFFGTPQQDPWFYYGCIEDC